MRSQEQLAPQADPRLPDPGSRHGIERQGGHPAGLRKSAFTLLSRMSCAHGSLSSGRNVDVQSSSLGGGANRLLEVLRGNMRQRAELHVHAGNSARALFTQAIAVIFRIRSVMSENSCIVLLSAGTPSLRLPFQYRATNRCPIQSSFPRCRRRPVAAATGRERAPVRRLRQR
jgi:hypothetical protein